MNPENGQGFLRELIELDTVDSTNNYALSLGNPFIAVFAHRQSSGKGRRGHTWHSPEGNIYLSVTLPGFDTRYTIMAGVAVREAASELLQGLEPKIKWPNDILVTGKKIAGILCESRPIITAIGIGINVNQTEWPEELKAKASSLKMITGMDFQTANVVHLVIDHIGKWYNKFLFEGFAPVKEAFLENHIRSDYRPMLQDGTEVAIIDIDINGFLVVEIDGRKKTLVNEQLVFSGYSNL